MKKMSNSIKNVYCFLKYKIVLYFLYAQDYQTDRKDNSKTWARLSKSRQIDYKVQNIFNMKKKKKEDCNCIEIGHFIVIIYK